MHREQDERREKELELKEDQSANERRHPIQVRATFIRLDRSPREQASAA